jgi:hypothetical protein
MMRKIITIIYLLSFALFPWLVMGPFGDRFTNIPLRLVAFGLLTVGGAYLFRLARSDRSWASALVITGLGYGLVYKFATFIPDVSSYPFSLGWSEGSRYYYASLWFSQLFYGMQVPPSVLHPSRYLLQSLAFLIPHSSLWFSRLWQVLLWLSSATLASWLLLRRLRLQGYKRPLLVSLSLLFWGVLFLFQGPVYYHLLFMVIIILWGFNHTHFWRSLVVVLIASLWAGISRVNWLPVPGILAAALYLLEAQVKDKSVWRYLVPPAVWVIAGSAVAFASQKAYQLWSGNPAAWFGSSFTSDLLWYRLWPNVTFPMGILPSAVLVSLPLVGLMLLRMAGHWRDYHTLRILGLIAILFVLFAGGVIVSVKIGGGSNLHNLDAYLALLMVISSYIYFSCFQPDDVNAPGSDVQPASSSTLFKTVESILLIAALVIPLYFTLSVGGPLPKRDFAAAQAALQTINSAAQQEVAKGGKVLFISQRHLLTFDYVKDVPLIPEDELVFLMEMAMSNNTAYMDAFQSDISQQRFGMIVSEPLVIQYQGKSHSFGEENDAWVSRVSEPVLCYYEPAIQLDAVGLVLYTPRANPCK